MLDGQRLILLLKQGKVVANKEIPNIKLAVQKKNDGKKLTPAMAEKYNDMAQAILQECLENKTVYNQLRNSLKKKNGGFLSFT